MKCVEIWSFITTSCVANNLYPALKKYFCVRNDYCYVNHEVFFGPVSALKVRKDAFVLANKGYSLMLTTFRMSV
jgi:hypothetical protein